MKDRKLAARYARALLAVLPDPASAEAADDFLAALTDAMTSHPELRDVLLNPGTTLSQRKGVLFAIADAHGGTRYIKNFLGTIADHGRLGALPAIAQVFREERETRQGVVAATMTTAVAVPADLQQRVAASLERLSGRKVRLTALVDPALVGGTVTQIGSTVFDGSVRTQLSRLHRRMAEE
jgi:F-type H+-transporting ATPase subunit delta